jgi:hypothetical protein
VLEVRLDASGVERLVVAEEGEITGVVLKVSLCRRERASAAKESRRREARRPTLSFSELTTSFLISFIRASLTAALVTALNPSSIRYLKPSTCFMSNLYSLTSPPLLFCAFSILDHTDSSLLAVSKLMSFFFFEPHSSRGTMKEREVPVLPARAVRPTRCV